MICVRSNRSPFFYFPYLYTCIICMSCVCQLLNKRIYDDDDDDDDDDEFRRDFKTALFQSSCSSP